MFASVTYDNRDRLIREEREQAYNGGSAATAYDYRYGYDQLGNRKWRIDAATSERPAYYYTYLYDTDVDPENLDWPTRNNRLLQYEIRKDSSSGDLLRTVTYTYYKTGHASNITVKDWYVDSSTTPGSAADYDWYHDLALYYFTNGSLRLAISDKWKLDGQGEPTNYTSLTAREFRYDGIGIARYLAVDYNTNNEPTDPGEWTLVGSPMLTDYAGSSPLTDSSITYSSSYSATAETRYFASDGRQSLGSGGSVEDLRYFHGDLIDSRVLATDDSAAAVATTAYTAFGEAVPPIGSPARPANPSTLDTRYQYAGRCGYEADMLSVGGPNSNLAAIILNHVGARWYQSNLGRFIQRDPVGLRGGANVYAYCKNDPLAHIDPTGLLDWDWFNPDKGSPESGVGVILIIGTEIAGIAVATNPWAWLAGSVVVVGTVMWGDDDLAALYVECTPYAPAPSGYGDGREPPLEPGVFGVDCRGCHRTRPIYKRAIGGPVR